MTFFRRSETSDLKQDLFQPAQNKLDVSLSTPPWDRISHPSPSETLSASSKSAPLFRSLRASQTDAGSSASISNAGTTGRSQPSNLESSNSSVEKPIRQKIGERAVELITGDREAAYGPPSLNFSKTAAIFNAIKGQSVLTAADVALLNVAQKLSREEHNYKRDNYRDAVGYLLIKAELEEQGYGKTFDLLDRERNFEEDEDERSDGAAGNSFDRALGQK
jgi:hypothetical protein